MTEIHEQGPSIILIGGEITLNSGARIDSRLPLEGDEWDYTLRLALGGSESFWTRAKAVADTILDQAGSTDAWAFVWSEKTAKRPKADGTFTRVRIVKLLDGADHLMDKSLLQGNSRIRAERLRGRYRIMPYIQRIRDVVVSSDPTVFIGSYSNTFEDEISLMDLNPLSYVVSRWPNITLILPHTPLIEQKVRELLDSHMMGTHSQPQIRPHSDELEESGQTQASDIDRLRDAAEASAEIRLADPYIIDQDLHITFWADQGVHSDAEDLEAAFEFLQSRFDLSIGFWDLVRDPVLRMSLLQPETPENIAAAPVAAPPEIAEAAEEKRLEKEATRLKETEARASLHAALWPRLKGSGWSISEWTGPGKTYVMGSGPDVGSLNPSIDREPAVYFALAIHKRQATVSLLAATRIEATETFLATHSQTIERITGRPPEPDKQIVVRFSDGGWDGQRGLWDEHLETVQACIRTLVPDLRSVIDAAVKFREEQLTSFAQMGIQIDDASSRKAEDSP